MILNSVSGIVGEDHREIDILRVPVGILALLLYVSFFAVATKRYHDQDKSGWSSLIFLAPVVGWLYVMIECGFWQGSAMRNQYGQPLYGPLTSIGLDEDDS